MRGAGRHRDGVALQTAMLLVAAVAGPSAAAQELRWDVRHGSGGVHRPGELIPAAISLDNGSGRDLRLIVDTELDGRLIRRPVELPAGTRKSFTLYVGPAAHQRAYALRLADARRGPVAEFQLTSRPLGPDQVAVGVVGDHSLGWGAVAGDDESGATSQRARRFQVAYLTGADLPGYVDGLRSLDVLAWIDPRPADLRPEQIDAVARWTDQGGHLVLAVRDAWLEAASGALAPWTAVRARQPAPARSLASLAAAADVPLPALAETLPVVALEAPATARVWLAEPFGATAVIEPRGRGSVTLLGFDPSEPPLSAWSGWGPFWQAWTERIGAVGPQPLPGADAGAFSQGARFMTLDVRRKAFELLSEEQQIEVPSLTLLISIFVAYLLVVGPLDYLVLRRLHRLTWTWITLPAIVALVSAGGYVAAVTARAGDPRVQHLVLRDLEPGSDRLTETVFASLFVTHHGDYAISSLEPARLAVPLADVRPFDPMARFRAVSPGSASLVYSQGTPAAVLGRVPRWSFLLGAFRAAESSRGARVDARLTLADGRLSGDVSAALGVDLEESWLVLDGGDGLRVYRLGALADGSRAVLDRVEGDPLHPQSDWPWPYAGEARTSKFAPAVMTQTVRRSWVRERVAAADERDRASPGARYPDPHPYLDWSALVEAGGAVLFGVTRDHRPRVAVVGTEPEHSGVVFYRVPLAPEVLRR